MPTSRLTTGLETELSTSHLATDLSTSGLVTGLDTEPSINHLATDLSTSLLATGLGIGGAVVIVALIVFVVLFTAVVILKWRGTSNTRKQSAFPQKHACKNKSVTMKDKTCGNKFQSHSYNSPYTNYHFLPANAILRS